MSKATRIILVVGIILAVAMIWLGTHKTVSPTPPLPQTEASEPPPTPLPVTPPPPSTKPVAQAIPSQNVIPICLTNFFNDADWDLIKTDTSYQGSPHGTQTYGGIEFSLQGFLNLQGSGTLNSQKKNYWTNAVVSLDETDLSNGQATLKHLGEKISCIYLLAGTRFESQVPNETVATVLWHYDDGTTEKSPLRYNVDLRIWYRQTYEDPQRLPNPLTKVAWNGPVSTSNGRSLRLYRICLVNPQPEKTIQSLEFASSMVLPSMLVAALTLDPLPPGSRPDNLTSDEIADPPLSAQLEVLVQDKQGRALPNSEVTATFSSKTVKSSSRKYTTGNTGLALAFYPDSDLTSLSVAVEHTNYSGRKILWDIKTGDTVPALYTFKLDTDVTIGGIVVDEQQAPIAGAALSIFRFWTSSDGSPNRKGEQPSFGQQSTKTDAQGRWKFSGLPGEFLNHIGFDVSQSNFVGTNITVGENSTIEAQLRAETFQIVLRGGQDVKGLVMDDRGVPISGATVWAGQKYSRDRKQTKTDSQGRFRFHAVQPGDVIFSVMAKERQPDFKTFFVKPDMADIVFRLGVGHILRCLVQDESNAPISGVRVVLEGNQTTEDGYEYQTTTGADGRFEWNGAPAQPVQFYFGKQGYESRRNLWVDASKDNVITLHRNRKLEGLVVDAESGLAVTNFSIRLGHRQDPTSDTIYGTIEDHQFTTPDGRFETDVNDEENNAVAVTATGYAFKVENLPQPEDGIVHATIRLKPAGVLNGVVVSPQGIPIAGANVTALGSQGSSGSIMLRGSHISSWDPRNKVSITDDQGKFSIGSTPEKGTVVAVGEAGFANVDLEQVRSSGTVVLQPWGRIEGTYKSGGQAASGKDVMLNLGIPGVGTDFKSYKQTTDEQGNFTFDRVPPGDLSIVRLFQTSPGSWQNSYGKNVHVGPGETVQVSLGDDGATLNGTARYETPPTNGESLIIQGTLGTRLDHPQKFTSAAEAQAFYSSEAWKAAIKQSKQYAFAVNADGSFMVENVVPGVYSLNILVRPGGQNSWSKPIIAQGQADVTVPEDATPTTSISVGEVLMKQAPQMNGQHKP